ncbi:MAG: NUDIX domain-containing protein [Nanoarchaeota archaeon]|nr:NUDIX domain-containing protein [Nanoarchaeota archaeon]
MISIRRKGVAIVNTKKGILLVAGNSKNFILPGGGAERKESRKQAAIRELYEETGLRTIKCIYLFSYLGKSWNNHRGKKVRNHTKVFLIEAQGIPRPRHEIKYVSFYKPNSNVNITRGTKKIIINYMGLKDKKLVKLRA